MKKNKKLWHDIMRNEPPNIAGFIFCWPSIARHEANPKEHFVSPVRLLWRKLNFPLQVVPIGESHVSTTPFNSRTQSGVGPSRLCSYGLVSVS